MNDKIKELAEQATKLAEAEYNSQTRQTFLTNKSNRELFNEKFAELIVRKCTDAIIKDSRLNDVRSAANGCVRTIKEHFGVEE